MRCLGLGLGLVCCVVLLLLCVVVLCCVVLCCVVLCCVASCHVMSHVIWHVSCHVTCHMSCLLSCHAFSCLVLSFSCLVFLLSCLSLVLSSYICIYIVLCTKRRKHEYKPKPGDQDLNGGKTQRQETRPNATGQDKTRPPLPPTTLSPHYSYFGPC